MDKKNLAKTALLAMVLTAGAIGADASTKVTGFETSTLLAVAGCGGGCSGKTNTSVKSDGQVADATGQMSTPSGAKTNSKASTMQNSNRYNSGNNQQGGGSKPAFNQDTETDDDDDDDHDDD